MPSDLIKQTKMQVENTSTQLFCRKKISYSDPLHFNSEINVSWKTNGIIKTYAEYKSIRSAALPGR